MVSKVKKRICPACGSINTGAVLDDIIDRRYYEAGCGCEDCKATWDEVYDKKTDTTTIKLREDNDHD